MEKPPPCAREDAPDLYRKPLAGHWFPGNAGPDGALVHLAISFPYLDNFATTSTMIACKARAEWTFSPKQDRWDSRPNIVDGQGHRRVTDATALETILDALPPQPVRLLLRDPVVVRSGLPATSELSEPARLPVQWKIVAGGKTIAKGEATERDHRVADNLPPGVHRAFLTDATSLIEEVPVIVAPQRAFAGDFDRGWLLAIQLYGVRSVRNWGMGDFTDLEHLIELARDLGADGIGLNPLHALFDDRPGDCSPYSPNSRLFLNPLYIDVEKIPELPSRALTESTEITPRLRQSETVDYDAIAGLKWRALRSAFVAFKAKASAERKEDFAKFRAERGALLLRFACFEVLRHKFKTAVVGMAGGMAATRRRLNARKLREGADASEIEFVEFVQWIADRQLAACSALADHLGMRVGLYLDIAVGVQANGFDAWNEQDAISRHLGVGAPPDPLNTAGQDWGLAGFNAAGLEQRSLRAVPPDAAGLDAPCRRGPARSCDGSEAALSCAARFWRRRRRLCADAVRGDAGGHCAGERGQSLRGDRRGPRHRARKVSATARGLGHLVLSGDDVRARRSGAHSAASITICPMHSSPSTPTTSRPMPAGARSAI